MLIIAFELPTSKSASLESLDQSDTSNDPYLPSNEMQCKFKCTALLLILGISDLHCYALLNTSLITLFQTTFGATVPPADNT